ncbi:MAG TPA: hypothetical protein ENG87_04470 [Candidatus Pacearchaeota archaeon]|nr:hypothetical protein BMS3Abin17_00779 [archaeon BMS3Abin17]HDK42610.1 hypothetical protein [Candidatus Pacearchaeota archaeon]HDZ61464.1 hypothetical protein [Candidatus Pacearchaeota archaeon]
MRNKGLSLIVLALLVISGLALVSAKTLIAGKIYNADFSDTIEGAEVTITCQGDVQNATSLDDGAYSVVYNETEEGGCENGASLTVSAVKGELYGSKTGIIHDNAFEGDWDLAIVNVPLVPEFGLIAGALTILSAVSVFFFIRKE